MASPTGTDIMVLVRLTTSPSCKFARFTEQHDADFLLLQVQRDAKNVVREGKHLASHDFFQAVNARDARRPR